MTQQGQWVCFGPDRPFAHKIDTGRVLPFESTTVPNEANSKLQEVIDIMMTEQRLEQVEKVEHGKGLPHAIKQMLTGHSRHTFCGGRAPSERSLEPLTDTEGDETVMNQHDDDNK